MGVVRSFMAGQRFLSAKLFAKICTPETPKGPCMVSSEGTCAAWYAYGTEHVS